MPKILQHKHCTDTAIWVLHKLLLPPGDRYRLKVRWINVVNPAHHYDMDAPETLYINVKQYNEDWHEVHCVRDENKSD